MTTNKLLLVLIPALALGQNHQANRPAPKSAKEAVDTKTLAADIMKVALQPPPPKDIPLSSTGNEAVSIAKQWQSGDAGPAAGAGGTVVYQFGAAMPPIVCAPERLTAIFLQPGERVQNPPVMGDTVRWEYVLMTAGEGLAARTSVVIKPKRPGISTDLILTTNRRSYQLYLVSKPDEHLSQVEFTYPLDMPEAWARYKAEEGKPSRAPVEPAKSRNFVYSVNRTKKPLPFTPRYVYDDGHQTFLEMNPAAKDWSTAVLQTGGPNGCEIVNYRVQGDTWIVDRLFTGAELVSGTGKKAQRVSIVRDGSEEPDCKKGK